jgi:tRNA(Ile)-lysidine synthase
LQFETRREELGGKASEELARNRRYAFLRALAKKYQAKIITAHHADDAVETVAINLGRGTGWRGLAILDSDIIRPLIDLSKSEIMDYAKQNKLQWHDDSTNASDVYLRNRMRQRLAMLDDDSKRQTLALRAQQIALKHDIDREVTRLVGTGPTYDRYFFTHADRSATLECLRFLTNRQLTRPQLERVLIAIKTAKPRTILEAGVGVEFGFTSRNFTIKLIK